MMNTGGLQGPGGADDEYKLAAWAGEGRGGEYTQVAGTEDGQWALQGLNNRL